MSLYLDPADMQSFASCATSALDAYNKHLQSLHTNLCGIAEDATLRAQSYANLKAHLSDVALLATGLSSANEYYLEALNQMLVSVGEEVLDEKALIEARDEATQTIVTCNTTIDSLQETLRTTPQDPFFIQYITTSIKSYTDIRDDMQEVYDEAVKKIEQLHTIDETLKNIASQIDLLYSDVQTALAFLSSSWTDTSYTPAGRNVYWKRRFGALEDVNNLAFRLENMGYLTPEEKKKFIAAFLDNFKDEFKENLNEDGIERLLNAAGINAKRVGDIITDIGQGVIDVDIAYGYSKLGPAGKGQFILLSNDALKGSDIVRTGTKVVHVGSAVKSVSKKVPIVGSAIDFGTQVYEGEDVVDAGVKTGLHVVGASVGMAGSMALVGMALGSAVPGVGTVVGLVVGCAAGAVINVVIDAVYDGYCNDKIGNAFEHIL
ncbi:MAG: hypothetical protein IJV62_03775 [Eggerthellaceae bacterium]|nr:hypothetical protein [Eggerthellaceae bacterium]